MTFEELGDILKDQHWFLGLVDERPVRIHIVHKRECLTDLMKIVERPKLDDGTKIYSIGLKPQQMWSGIVRDPIKVELEDCE